MSTDTLDIRHLPKAHWLAQLSQRFAALPVGGSLTLIGGCHDLDQLHGLFHCDWSGGYEWEQVSYQADVSQDRLLRTAAAKVPRILTDTTTPCTAGGGAVWTLQPGDRQLDANIIRLPPGDRIDAPTGSDLDVLMIVLHGVGNLDTETGPVSIEPGHLAWLPRGSGRSIIAGPQGLSYLTVHTRRPPMTISRSGTRVVAQTGRLDGGCSPSRPS
jgi:uncharacterized protein (DUF2249 family)